MECKECKTDYLLSSKKCYKKIAGCKTNIVNNEKVECTECLIDYNLITKGCQKKVLPTSCDGNANVIWKNGADYCNKCKSAFYTYEGKCYAKTTLAGC